MPSPIAASIPLADRLAQARALARQRLLEQRRADGSWRASFDTNALCNALYLIALSRLGRLHTAPDEAAALLRHLLGQRNPDGGFYMRAGAASSPALTRLARFALRAADADPGLRARAGEPLQRGLAATTRFLADNPAGGNPAFELTHGALADAYAPYLEPGATRLGALGRTASRRAVALLLDQAAFHRILRGALPALTLLFDLAPEDNLLGRLLRQLPSHLPPHPDRLRERILAGQNRSGDWLYNSVFTALNLFALHAAGLPTRHPALGRALGFLRHSSLPDDAGGRFVSVMRSDVWDTTQALLTLMPEPTGRPTPELGQSVDWLLDNRGSGGGWAWAAGSEHDTDSDSTAQALRVLQRCAPLASPTQRAELPAAGAAALRFLFAHQHPSGGFGVWESAPIAAGRGPAGWLQQFLFDAPTADLTARVVEALLEAAPVEGRRAIDRGTAFLLRHQHPHGGWWCRWWAGYLAGTGFALRALGPQAHGEPTLASGMHRGARFLLTHQNADGGWGEGVAADTDAGRAGCGASTPLHTASSLSALLRSGHQLHEPAVARGFHYLLTTMHEDGRWHDHQATFSVISGGIYYPYPFLNHILPLAAIEDGLAALRR